MMCIEMQPSAVETIQWN